MMLDLATLQKWVDDTPDGHTLQLPAGLFRLSMPLSLRGRRGLRIVGSGMPPLGPADEYGTRLDAAFPPAARSGLPIIDMTGARTCALENLAINKWTTAGADTAYCGILLARDASKDSTGNHRLTNVFVAGRFEAAAIVDYGAEDFIFDNVHMLSAVNGTSGYLTSSHRPEGLSDYIETAEGWVSNVNKTFRGCFFRVPQGGQDYSECSAVHLLPGSRWIRFDDCAFRGRQACRSIVRMDAGPPGGSGGGTIEGIWIRDAYCETQGAEYWLEEDGDVRDVRITGGRFQARKGWSRSQKRADSINVPLERRDR